MINIKLRSVFFLQDSECYSILLSRITPAEMYVDNHPMCVSINIHLEGVIKLGDCGKVIQSFRE